MGLTPGKGQAGVSGMSPDNLQALVFGLLALIIWLGVMSLPGLVLTYLGWMLSRAMQPARARNLLRAALIAVLLTPTMFGHGALLPAILIVWFGPGKEKLIGIVPILVVWIIAIPVVSIAAKKREQAQSARQ